MVKAGVSLCGGRGYEKLDGMAAGTGSWAMGEEIGGPVLG